ncbi:hypothetical protein ILYODFUR_035367 [Ilyodon furcidens]|uniref:Secreted protein n=1 Tax=Ilyodon furcidens TaxID=33524 RepID=A0ABV0VJS7_9TELE
MDHLHPTDLTARCCCIGVAHLSAISWASYGVETQREASAPCLTWRNLPSTEESHGIFLVSCFHSCHVQRSVETPASTPQP